MIGFPIVPIVPGVPPLPRNPAGGVPAPIDLLSSDLVTSFGQPGTPQWGIFKNGQSVVSADSVISMGYRQEWSLLEYPVEQGGFETYNKVASAFDVRVRFASGGNVSTRRALLDSIAAIADSLDLFDVVTPEAIYTSVNVMHYDYHRRSDDGVGLLKVDVICLEIRVTATASFSHTKKPTGADPVSTGTVQTSAPTKDQKATIVQHGATGKW